MNQEPDAARKSAPKKRGGFALDKLIFALAVLVVVFAGATGEGELIRRAVRGAGSVLLPAAKRAVETPA